MTAAELQARFPSCRVIAADIDYAVPSRDWLLGKFWVSFKAERWAKGITSWERRNDCDNFARAYAQHAQDCHAITATGVSEGIAVGEFFYHQAKGGGHAINVAFVDHECRRIFIEPQTGLEMVLTEAEINSCFFVRF